MHQELSKTGQDLSRWLLFRMKKTGIVDAVVVHIYYWARVLGGGEGWVWKVRARAVGFKQGT
jgi:hypothetical protein